MSRAYRIRVSESLTKVIRASDHVQTCLELLEILPPESMGALLKQELAERGFEETDEGMARTRGDITVLVDVETGTVTVRSESERSVELKTDRDGWVYDEDDTARRRQAEERTRKEARAALEKDAERRAEKLQKDVTDTLERELADVQSELGGVVNRVTATALKQKAAQLGEIKELTEDPESGNMTIVLEV